MVPKSHLSYPHTVVIKLDRDYMKEIEVRFTQSNQYGDYAKGEIGFFLSAVFNGERPYLVVANKTRGTIVLCISHEVELLAHSISHTTISN